ncbi:MAG: Spy/CpxP family protein refolding chaperone [Calditrichaeota bacterium]|nr:Spy/CpxP family protein refolding chaperone [Calditrichota bacterium]
MSKKTISWLLLISLIINFSVLATFSYYRWLHNSKNTARSHRSDFRSRMKKRLNLTDDQEKQINDLRAQFFERIRPLRNKIHAQRRDMMQLISQDSVDTNLVMQKLDSLKELEKQIDVESVKNLLRYREALSAEQQKRFMKMITGRMHRDSRRGKPGADGKNSANCPADSIDKNNSQ